MTDRGARRTTLASAAALTLVLLAVSGRYGFHRDELYFVEAGRHPAFGYPDSPPLVPILAAAWHALVGGHLTLFRIVPALAAGATVVVAAAASRALTGRSSDAAWAAVITAGASGLAATGHLFSTTTFDVLITSVVVLLLVRAVDVTTGDASSVGVAPARHRSWRPWLLLGAVSGLGLQVKTLPATVLLACGLAILLVGPRQVLRRPGPWIAAAVALLLAAPDLIWQARHGWPQLAMSRAIAEGGSGTSVDRWLVVPLQVTLTGPVLAVVAGVGVVALVRTPPPARHRWVAVAYAVLLVILVATGGKAYYALGLVPVLLAAGAPGVRAWVQRPDRPVRRRVAVGLMVSQVIGTALFTLPVLPVRSFEGTVFQAANYDTGETVGWPELVEQVETVVATLPAADRERMIIMTENYGEAGALSRARRAGAELPAVYSGHNGYGEWGPPPAAATGAVVVGGFTDAQVGRWFVRCRVAATVDNGVGVDNDEQGAPIRVCTGLTGQWAALWPTIRHLG